ncbi:ornithine aminotransferase [Neurospora tetrasperma FGSC 2508]|uniref:Ornithine aminotransferase n=1 Tax=Neurospora tetrasperma (strain FGSC 2508 / ATCC MYA-4615 / P0657) TaxID=510951 RepID=F8MML6_NEUT8|nr:ornithine aminotransferase [Neurospora tetrasperma FGSC 2508]EGO57890.1 ornithine aminotransferase [Neurospora tetrasperma FGSC 2508]EGZ71823.1 ornithine aminotransferase [Neurospora tetrasperma FGSC 2509]
MAPLADTASNGGSTLSLDHLITGSDKYHAAATNVAIAAENEYAAHNYHPLPVVFAKAQGVHVWDPEGKHYLDFLSAYSAVNQGHCHPELVKALTEQASRLTLSSRAFHNDVFPVWAAKVRSVFGYDMVLPMNTGAEAVETAIKIARKWAYKVKGVPHDKALVFSAADNFHGRTMTAISLSVDPESRDNYGPYVPQIGAVSPSTGKTIRYNNIADLEEVLEAHGKETAAFIVEPIQGEAGVVVPDEDYLQKVSALCKKHNVLFICDEIQTGIARTGRMLCSDWANIKPDIITLGKAISGGMYPVSAVLADKEVMLVVEPGTHGSTYGGNPLGCAVSLRALELVEEEGLVEKAEKLGQIFREGVEAFKSPIVKLVRGKGLLNAVVIDESAAAGRTAWDLCILLKEKGVLAKPTHGNIIRFAPPLVITEEELRGAIKTFGEALQELPTVTKSEGH